MMTTTEPTAPAVWREDAEAHGQAGRGFAAASAALHSLSVSAEAAHVAVDTASNAFIRAEAALIRAAEALEASSGG